MNTQLILQIAAIIIGIMFIYWGGLTIFSKKYFLEKWNKNNSNKKVEKYEDLKLSSAVYSRYGWGGQWLVLGLCLIGLVMYSFFKL